jgi:3-mercaptopyruvate sulfurtransferase SseA
MRQRAQPSQPESAGSVQTGPSGQPLPDVLADADWVQAHLDDPGVVPVEITEDTSAYDQGHIKGAVKLDWMQDLQDPRTRGFIDRAGFEALLSRRGIANDDTVILYSGDNNSCAAYALWYFKVYGHRGVRLLDGGRKQWELDSREMVTEVPHRPATVYRSQKPERWIRMVIRSRSQGTWSPRRRRWPWQAVSTRLAVPGLGPSRPSPARRRKLTGVE